MRALLKILPLIPHKLFKVDEPHLRSVARALSQHVAVPNQETLTGRILLYLNVDKENRPKPSKCASEILRKFRQNGNYFQKLSTYEIMSLPSILNDQNVTQRELLALLKEFDNECCLRLTELNCADVLKLLTMYMRVIPGHITWTKFYKHALIFLYDSLHSLNKKDLMQLIFYIGLQKKTVEAQKMHRDCIKIMNKDFIYNLTREELCIICNSTFKTSTKILNKYLLDKVRVFLNNNLAVLKDSALFVTLVKTLRHNRYQNDDLLNTISYTIFFNKTFSVYSFSMICHVMALFADYFFYDEKFFQLLTKICLEQLEQSSFLSKKLPPTEQLRGKDIKRFLWVTSMFSEMKLVSHSDIKNVIIPKLIERVQAGEFENDHNSLVDITLYLWMLNFRPDELVPYVFNEKIRPLMSNNSKSNLRLNLLLHAIHIESPDLAEKLLIKPVSIPSNVYSTYQLHKRPLIQRLLHSLQRIKKELNLNRFELSQEIPHLNIVGITGYKDVQKKAVYVEVLDDYTRIKNIEDDVPVGLMALKLRLLDHSDEGVLVVSQKEVGELVDADLSEYLLDELELIC